MTLSRSTGPTEGAPGSGGPGFRNKGPQTENPQAARVARFLKEHGITIILSEGNSSLRLEFLQNGGAIGEMVWDNATQSVVPATVEEMQRRLNNAPNGFLSEVTRPIARLLAKNNGDFYAEDFEPIHDVCDAVEAGYPNRGMTESLPATIPALLERGPLHLDSEPRVYQDLKIEDLIEILKGPNPLLQGMAASELGYRKDQTAVAALSAALSADWSVRCPAAHALGEIGGDEAIAALCVALDNQASVLVYDRLVRIEIQSALRKLGAEPKKKE